MKKMSQYEIDQEVDRLQANLGSVHIGFKTRTTHAIAKALLLKGWYFWNGQKCTPIAKSVGCGVYEVSLSKEE